MKMMKWLWLLALVLAGGCLKIEADETSGTIVISGGKVDPQRAVLDLMRERQWTHERAGSRTASSTSVRKGIGVSTREGLILPSKSKRESSQSWTSARTTDGKQVLFEIDSATREPTTVKITVEEGASVSTAEVTAELARRLREQVHPRRTADPLTIHVEALAPSADDANRYEGSWTASGDWGYRARHARFEIRTGRGGSRQYSVYVDGPAPWAPRGADRQGPLAFELKRRVGTMAFEGQRYATSGQGDVTLDPNAAYVDALADLVGERPGPDDLLNLFFNEMELDYARQMKEALGDELTLRTLLTFASRRIAPEYVRGIRDAGYHLPPDQIVRLSSYHIPLEMLASFKQAGYDFSVDQLIKIRSYHLTAEEFVAFREAGYDFSIAEMIKAKSYHLPVETARTLHEAGFDYSLDELIKLRSYHVPPEAIVAFREGGYNLSLDEVIKARSYHVSVDDAVRLKQVGYDFTLDELIRLKSYHVPMEFMIELYDPDYEPFTAEELIAFRQKRIDAPTIKKIRTARSQ